MKGILSAALVSCVGMAGAQGTAADYTRAAGLQQRFRNTVFSSNVSPHWLDGGKQFWYSIEVAPGKWEFNLVDARSGAKRAAFDTGRLATALTAKLGHAVSADNPSVSISAADRGSVTIGVDEKRFKVDLRSYELTEQKGPGGPVGTVEAFLPVHPSGNAGEESEMVLENRSQIPVNVFWVDTDGRRVAYGRIEPGKSLAQHTYAEHVWLLTDSNNRPLAAYSATAGRCSMVFDGTSPTPTRQRRNGGVSPDGKWRAIVKDHNVWLHPIPSGDDVQVSTDGKEGDDYDGTFLWSPDGKKLMAIRQEAGQEHKVYEVQSSPTDQLQPRLRSFDYLKPGDKVPHPRVEIFDAATHSQTPANETLAPNPYEMNEYHWSPDSKEVYYVYNQRGHQVLRLLAADAATGAVRTVIEETSKTFVDYSQKTYLQFLDKTNEALWTSERSGYNHVYLVNLKTGQASAVTSGDWVVRSVDRVDEDKRELLLRIMGYDAGQDPYHFHHATVRFDGSHFVKLTDGDGTHRLTWAPDRSTFVDTYSRVDMAPATELRRASDGKLLCSLEKSNISRLEGAGWQRPERFVAKGRDGKTDIYGVIYRPTNFDPARKYPVVEYIYAGPHDFFVPKTFAPTRGTDRVGELGFVIVQIEGMGTNWRSKAFHDVCFQNLADAGFPDRILWMQAAGATRPWMDLSRVGIYGTSAGGQSAASAVMRFGDFYKAAVADCGCHDNRMDKIWWNEAWMGWPIGPSYEANSNVTAAKNLKGKLYLMVGEVDTNVDPASTMQVVNALIRAGKDFDFLEVPNSNHGVLGQPYPFRRMQEFFVHNLLGVEPGR